MTTTVCLVTDKTNEYNVLLVTLTDRLWYFFLSSSAISDKAMLNIENVADPSPLYIKTRIGKYL